MTATTDKLRFGYQAGLPGHTRAAWGARWIWPDDQVWDRQDAFGSEADKAALFEWLNRTVGVSPRVKAAAFAATGQLRPDESREVVLYRDDVGVVKANPNGSYGYLYVAAYLYAHAPKPSASDPPFEARPTCPSCGGTMRRDLDRDFWTCDLHGEARPVFVTDEDEAEDDGYEPGDPKSPGYVERMADWADDARKRAKGE